LSRRASRNALLAWANLAFQTSELMLASANVIQHRTRRMAVSGLAPREEDRREFARMGREKLIGFGASAAAINASILAHQRLATKAVAHSLASGGATLSLLNSRTAAEAFARQIKLAQTIVQASSAAARVSGSAARVSLRGLAPVSRIAKANAKRLRKR
jgi:hypothetical protein